MNHNMGHSALIPLLKRLEWNILTSFLSVCQTGSLSISAKELNVSRSTMSERLSKLEDLLGLQLLNREHKKIYVNEQGLHLAKYIFPMIVLENFSLRLKEGQCAHQWIGITFPLRNYGNPLCLAVERLIQSFQARYPDILMMPQNYDSYNVRPVQEVQWQPEWLKIGNIEISWETELNPAQSTHHPIVGRWCIVSHHSHPLKPSISLTELRDIKLFLPKMPWRLLQQIATISEGFNLSFEQIGHDYSQFTYSDNAENRCFLVNTLLIGEEQLTDEWHITYIENFPTVYLSLQAEGVHPAIADFMTQFPASFFAKEPLTWPVHSKLKHWYYMRQTMRSGSITVAAQSLYMSQSALSTQLKQLEKELGSLLLERRMGVRTLINTDAGHAFSEILSGVESYFTYLLEQCDRRKQDQRRQLVFGILPSIDINSTFVRMIVNQVKAWLQHYPDVKLEIVEERHRYLVDGLRSGEVQLAVLEADSPWVTHIPIQQPEEMGLVIHKSLISAEIETLHWRDLQQFELVLPRRGNGIRLIIDKHCLAQGVKLHPVIESDSLNINQYWLQEGTYCTILPRSAVTQLVAGGEIRFIRLVPKLDRVLRLAYLNQRVLSEMENHLLDYLISET